MAAQRGTTLLLCSWAMAAAVAAVAGEVPQAPVAVIESAQAGVAVVAADGREPVPATAGVVLVAGSRVLVGKGAGAIVALADGRRWRLAGTGSVVIGKDGPIMVADATNIAGTTATCEALETVPALVRIMPVLAEAPACATRIRSATARIQNIQLRPASRSQVVAEPMALGFEPPPGYSRFRVRLFESWDRTILDVVSDRHRLEIPADVLTPGRSYRWQVETLDRDQPPLLEVAVFTTVGGEAATARAELANAASREPSLQALLSAVDRALCVTAGPAASSLVSEPLRTGR